MRRNICDAASQIKKIRSYSTNTEDGERKEERKLSRTSH
jgi:hypothetical protein